jgi:archaellum component FlaF (FlaF/FlaG flagellin family)
MLAAISQADATVVAATLAFFGSVYAAWRANNTNRREHAVNTGKLDAIAERQSTVIENQETIRREVSFIRADVTDIHGVIGELRRADHDTDARVTRLERHQPQGEAS